jgi:hypothetical protein
MRFEASVSTPEKAQTIFQAYSGDGVHLSRSEFTAACEELDPSQTGEIYEKIQDIEGDGISPEVRISRRNDRCGKNAN